MYDYLQAKADNLLAEQLGSFAPCMANKKFEFDNDVF